MQTPITALAVTAQALIDTYGLTLSLEDIRSALFPDHQIGTLRNWKARRMLPPCIHGRYDALAVAQWWASQVADASRDRPHRPHAPRIVVTTGRRHRRATA